MALDILYVFRGGGHGRGVRFREQIHLGGQNWQKQAKRAKNGLFSPFLEVFGIFLKNRSNDFD